MSTVTFAMPTMLDGPVPEAPRHALLSVPGVVVDAPGTRWQNGASILGYPVSEPETWDPCSTGTFRTKSEGEAFPTPVFASFVVYLPITCSAMGMGDPDDFRDRARRTLEAVESFAVERALTQGVDGLANTFFDDAAVALLNSGAAVAPEVGLSFLEDAIGETGRRGMIHATPAVVAAWGIGAGVGAEPGDWGLHSPNGNPIAAGGGYIGGQPSGGSAPAAGQAWAYATGPVEVRHAEVEVLDIKDVLDRSTNDATFRAERAVLATWDTALQAAVLIDWTP